LTHELHFYFSNVSDGIEKFDFLYIINPFIRNISISMRKLLPKKCGRLLPLFFLIFSVHFAFGQLEVTPANTPPFTPENLITNVFLGDGVEVVGITYDGVPAAVGYFTNGEDDMGIDRGIIMSSGEVTSAPMANNSGSTSGTTSGSSVPDADLSTIANANIFDVARYEISFIPISDTLRFRFVFASEEYPEYACTSFNDAFGFFISGPGINGTFTNNAENIALVPDPSDPTGLTFTDVPVTINNVNNEGMDIPGGCLYDYGMYYNDNSGSLTMTYDAYLDVFTAQAVVTPCSTYTIKLAICDRGDSVFDSAVFLEAKSFGTGSLDVQVATLSLDGTITEECSGAEISFCLPNLAESDYDIDYNLIGTAEEGVDFPPFPDSLFIPAGDSCVSIFIDAFEDGIPEGLETIGIDIQRDPCNRDTFWVNIRDNELIPPDLGPDTTICKGDSVQLDGTLPIQLPDPPSFTNDNPVVFSSNNSPQFSDIDVFGVQPFTLADGVIQSICIEKLTHRWIDDVDLYLISPGGQFIELSTDNGADGGNLSFMDSLENTCFTLDATTPINFPGPFAPASALPLSGNWQPEGVWSDLWDGDNPTNGTWRMQLFDDTPGFSGTLFSWTITFEPVYKINYQWMPTDGLSCSDCPDPIAKPDTTTTYYLEAWDSYGCYVYDTITIEVLDILPPPDATCEVVGDTSVLVTWPELAGSMGYEVNVDGTGWVPWTGTDTITYSIDGLTYDQCVDIQVRGVGMCKGESISLTCCTPSCTPPDVLVLDSQGASCSDSADGFIQVEANGVNPPFVYTITGIGSNTDGIFSNLLPGPYTINVLDAANCPTSLNVVIKSPDSLLLSTQLVNGVSCAGGSDGSVVVLPTGGTAPYTYAWSSGSLDSLASGLSIGNYTVTVEDANGCTAEASIDVGEEDALTIIAVADTVSCFGEADGTAIAMAIGGNVPYSYQWDTLAQSQTTAIATGLAAGTYSVTVTDDFGCSAETQVSVGELAELVLSTGSFPTACFSSFNGKAYVNAQGGDENYSYSWNDIGNQVTDTAYNLKADEYMVVVSDGRGCIDTAFVEVEAPDSLSASFSMTITSCNNTSDGQIAISVSGGTGPYSYQWLDGVQTDSVRSDLASGQYTVTIIDANNCQKELPVEVDSPEEVSVVVVPQEVSCLGIEDGAAAALPSGGVGGYAYAWSDGIPSDSTVSGLAAGIYTVTLTDANNCTAVDTFEVGSQDAILLQTIATDIDCNGDSTGTASVSASGGVGDFSYLWSQSDTTDMVADLAAGAYFITVLDANGCLAMDTVTISEPPALQNSFSLQMVSCNTGTDGQASVIPSGGVAPYSYAWSNNQTDSVSVDWSAGTHTVTITDANDCIFIDTFTLTEPDVLLLTLDTVIQVDCFGEDSGLVQVEAEGGVEPYTYEWSDPAIGNTSKAPGLTAGPYTVTVTDSNGCTEELFVEVTEPDELTSSFVSEDVDCFGASTGTIDVSVQGGTLPYVYEWSNTETTQDLNGIPAGNYSLLITDANGCTSTLDAQIGQPDELLATFSIENVDCFGGDDGLISVDVSGGTTPYQYNWDGPGTFSSNDEDIANLIAGIYDLTITDANDCTFFLTQVEVQQPDEAVLTEILPSDLICEGATNGSATVTVSGGTGPYSYLWSNGQTAATATGLEEGSYSVTVTDSQNCTYENQTIIESYGVISGDLTQTAALCNEGTDGTAEITAVYYDGQAQSLADFSFSWNSLPIQNGTTAFGLTGGQSYQLTITNSAGCTAVETIAIGNPDEIQASITNTDDVSCFGGIDGTATAIASGGTGTLTYFWGSNSGGQTTATATDLAAGTYIVTITDANGCQSTAEALVGQPDALALRNSEFENVDCYGENTGSISVEMLGGTPPYAFAWNNGLAGMSIQDLEAGTYVLTVTDDNGCTFTWEQEVRQPDVPITGIASSQPVSCYGDEDGRIFIEPTGGTAPYIYSIDGENFNGSSIQIGLEAGYYPSIFVKDSRGCLAYIGEVYVEEPDPVEVDLGPDIELLFGENVILSPDISNAVSPITYFWSPSDSLDCLSDPCSAINIQPAFTNTWELSIRDARGCQADDRVIVYVRKERGVHVPTAFTPDGIGANDILFVRGRPGTLVKTFRVFDRWGETVFEARDFEVNDPTYGWDGTFRSKELNTGVYVWYAEVEYEDGFIEIYKGSTNLLR
jgi:gliding motility-associated-like protein